MKLKNTDLQGLDTKTRLTFENLIKILNYGKYEPDINTTDVSAPPLDVELDAIYGKPEDQDGPEPHLINKNNANTNVYLVVAINTKWWVITLTAAA